MSKEARLTKLDFVQVGLDQLFTGVARPNFVVTTICPLKQPEDQR